MKKLFAAIVAFTMAFTLAACEEGLEEELVDITLQSDVEEADLSQSPAEVAEGMDVTVTASEVDGYDFVQWTDVDTDEEVSTDREYTFTAEDAVTLEAVYEDTGGNGSGGDGDDLSVDLSSDVSGASLSASEEGPYEAGDEITIEATEVDTYTFQHWLDTESDTVLSEDLSYTFTVDGDMAIEAVYEDTLSTEERDAQTVVDGAADDMGYLDTVMEDYDFEEGMTMTMNMGMEMEDPESSDPLVYDMNVEIANTMEDGNRVSKVSMTMDNPEMEDTLSMTMIMEEGADSTTYTFNTEMLVTMIEEEYGEAEGEPLDFKSLLDMNSDYVHLTIPNDIEDTDQEAVYNRIMEEIYADVYGEDYDESDIPDYNQDTVDTITENLMDMKDFLSFSNLSEYEDIEFDMSRDGTVATGTLTMGGPEFRSVAEDFFEEVYTALEAADDTGELPSYSDVTDDDQYSFIMGIISMMPDTDLTIEYDSSTEAMNADLDLMPLINTIQSNFEEDMGTNIQDMTMEMTMEQGATIDDDTSDSENIEGIMEEVIQVATVMNSSTYLGTLAADDTLEAATHTLSDLETHGYYIDLPYLDKDLSEVTIEDTADGRTLTLELYYAHDESAVFEDTALTLSDLSAVIPTDTPVRDDVTAMTALVSDTNFALYPILGTVLEKSFEETDPVTSNPIPEEDKVTDYDEPTTYERYSGSVWVLYNSVSEGEAYTYVTEDSTDDIKNYFETHLDEGDWTLEGVTPQDTGYTIAATNSTENLGATVEISEGNDYDSGNEYTITLGPLA